MTQTDQVDKTVAQGEERRPGLNLPVDLIRRVKSAAALQGVSFKQFVADALEAKLSTEAAAAKRQ